MSRNGIKPIDNDGEKSIEALIELYKRKKARAIKFKDFRSADCCEEKIKHLQQILKSRGKVTAFQRGQL